MVILSRIELSQDSDPDGNRSFSDEADANRALTKDMTAWIECFWVSSNDSKTHQSNCNEAHIHWSSATSSSSNSSSSSSISIFGTSSPSVSSVSAILAVSTPSI